MNAIRLILAVSAAILVCPVTAWAEANAIKQIQVRRDGNQTLIKIQLKEGMKAAPGNWSIVEPPRIVFDFPETENQTGSSSQRVASGDLKSLNVVQAENLTRLVLNLYRPTKFSTELNGNELLVKLESGSAAAGNSQEPSSFVAPSAKNAVSDVLSPVNASVRDVSFRRGEDGQGLVTIDLSDGTVPVDVKRTPLGLTVELRGVDLPNHLRNRRDVVDFATPVSYISSQTVGDITRLEISAKGKWFHQANLTNNQLLIEVKPIPAEDANKLVLTGQQGQKVSINFYEAESTMVLRTLADISGKNVMVDPSLVGKKVTVNLENIPYDQALEIVMAQVGASMRIRNDVVLFGDRELLQKRDQDQADEFARASDTAPLTAETFELNYLKVADIVALISAAPSTQSSAPANRTAPLTETPTLNGPATAPATPGESAAGTKAVAGKGMLSARGSMTSHEATNKLFVRDTMERIDAIRQVIRTVDIPARQVLIEARIVRADTSFNRDLGMRIGFNDVSSTVPGRGVGDRIAGNVYGTVATTSADLLSLTGQTVGGGTTLGTVGSAAPQINLPAAASPTGQFAVSVFNSALTKFINLELQAAESEGRTINISSPRVVTANNLEARIARGQKIPYSTYTAAGATPTLQYLDATLSLTVKPQIAPNGTVILELAVTNNSLAGSGSSAINVTELKTKVSVDNGGTVVLGGVITDDSTNQDSRVPFLSDIPVIGNFFKSTSKISSKGELLVFITPRVLDQALSQTFAR